MLSHVFRGNKRKKTVIPVNALTNNYRTVHVSFTFWRYDHNVVETFSTSSQSWHSTPQTKTDIKTALLSRHQHKTVTPQINIYRLLTILYRRVFVFGLLFFSIPKLTSVRSQKVLDELRLHHRFQHHQHLSVGFTVVTCCGPFLQRQVKSVARAAEAIGDVVLAGWTHWVKRQVWYGPYGWTDLRLLSHSLGLCLFVCLCLSVSLCVSVCVSLSLFLCLSVSLFVSVSVSFRPRSLSPTRSLSLSHTFSLSRTHTRTHAQSDSIYVTAIIWNGNNSKTIMIVIKRFQKL